MQPGFVADGRQTSLVDSLFMSTSAVCVTGLASLDVSTHFNWAGKTALMLLFQLGGLGIMLLTSSLLLMFGGRLGLRGRTLVQEQMQGLGMATVVQLTRYTLVFVFLVEMVGAVLLFTQFRHVMGTGEAWMTALFHAISAFCNCGFSTFSNNLVDYRCNEVVSFTVMALIVIGGLGVMVVSELLAKLSGQHTRSHLSLHTRLVVYSTIVLILGGALVFGICELDNPQVNSGWDIITMSLFQSVTCRTAGLNTVDLTALSQASKNLMIGLMFIGGAPGSMAGGIKVTTFALLILASIAQIRGKRFVVVHNRSIAWQRIMHAVALTMMALFTVIVTTCILNLLEDLPFDALLFEVVSALGTVGLTLDVTYHLSAASKVLLCIAMFMGRVGPLTLVTSLVAQNSDAYIRYPEGEVVIG